MTREISKHRNTFALTAFVNLENGNFHSDKFVIEEDTNHSPEFTKCAVTPKTG
jgi:hypothetical protein